MNDDNTSKVRALAKLIRTRNSIDDAIADIIQRPALPQHIGEFIAVAVFDIEPERSAAQAGHDGPFVGQPFSGKTVNIKLYGKREGLLDINEKAPDFYLVLTGPKATSVFFARENTALVIEEVFLFDALKLIEALPARGTKLGVASSVPAQLWEQARVYPRSAAAPLHLSDVQLDLLEQLPAERTQPRRESCQG